MCQEVTPQSHRIVLYGQIQQGDWLITNNKWFVKVDKIGLSAVYIGLDIHKLVQTGRIDAAVRKKPRTKLNKTEQNNDRIYSMNDIAIERKTNYYSPLWSNRVINTCVKNETLRICPEVGRMLKCFRCKEFWPADTEFYFPLINAGKGLHSHCKACYINDRYPKGRKNFIHQ